MAEVVAFDNIVVALLCFMFILVVAWLVAVPACCQGGDLAHTTKVSHHVCTSFLACPLPWMGHLVVRQEQAGSPH